MRPILFIFLLSFIARGVIVIVFLPKIKEVRKVEVKPIFNVKSMPVYKWLYDISMREHSRLKSLKPHKRNRNRNHS